MKPLVGSSLNRFSTISGMHEMGLFMLRNRLRKKHPEESEGQINARVARWMGGELQPRDVGGLLAPSQSPRFVSHDE